MTLARKETRISGMLPVRISVQTGESESMNCLAHTLDFSMKGARLGGVTLKLARGATIEVHRRETSQSFKVAWVDHQHVGVESRDDTAELWGIQYFPPLSEEQERLESQARRSDS